MRVRIRVSCICISAPTDVACPVLFLRLQFELKKTVDTRTIGCVAAARSSPLLSSYLPSSQLLFIAVSFSLSSFDSMTTKMRIRTKYKEKCILYSFSWTNLASSHSHPFERFSSSLNSLTILFIKYTYANNKRYIVSPAKQFRPGKLILSSCFFLLSLSTFVFLLFLILVSSFLCMSFLLLRKVYSFS